MRLGVIGAYGQRLFFFSYCTGNMPGVESWAVSTLWAPSSNYGEGVKIVRRGTIIKHYRIASARGDFECFSELDETGADLYRSFPQFLHASAFEVGDEVVIEPRSDVEGKEIVRNWDYLMWLNMSHFGKRRFTRDELYPALK